MAIYKFRLLRSFFESLGAMHDGLSKPFLKAAVDGLEAVFESEEDAAADAGRAAESIASIDKSIGLVNTSAEALANAQDSRVKAAQSSPLAASEDKSGIESKATEAKEQIRQSTDAKVAELTERKKAIETNLAARQLENG
jgi:hypothetical protein